MKRRIGSIHADTSSQGFRWPRYMPAILATGIYPILVLVANGRLQGAGIIATLPVLVIAWRHGARPGLIAGALALPANIALDAATTGSSVSSWLTSGGALGSVLLMLVAGIVGRLTDVLSAARWETRTRIQAESLLRSQIDLQATQAKIAGILGGPDTFQVQAKAVLYEIQRITEASRVSLRVFQQSAQGLVFVASTQSESPESPIVGLDSECGRAFKQRRPIVRNGDIGVLPEVDDTFDGSMKSSALAPIITSGEPAGILIVASESSDHFTQERMEVLSSVAIGMGPAMENAQLNEIQKNQVWQQAALFDLAAVFAEAGSFEEKAARLLNHVQRLVEVDQTTLRELGDDGTLTLVASVGSVGSPPISVIPADSILGIAAQESNTIISNDVPNDPRSSAMLRGQRTQSLAALPIVVGGSVVATISALSLQKAHFTQERTRLIQLIANEIGPFIQSARLAEAAALELEQGRHRVEAFRSVAGSLDLGGNPRESLQSLVDSARELVAARCGALVVWDKNGDIESSITSGLAPDSLRGAAPRLAEQSLAVLVHDSKDAVRLGKLFEQPPVCAAVAETAPINNFVGIPLTLRDGMSGALYLTNKLGTNDFSSDDENLLGLFAVQATVLMKNLTLFSNESRERSTLAAVQESITEGLIVLDHGGNVLYRNKVVANATNIPDQHILGRPMWKLLRAHRAMLADPDQTAQLVLDVISRSALGPATIGIAVERPHHHDYVLTAFPIPVEEQEPLTGLLVRDISDERELERQRDGFISTASHELRTPTAAILGFTELLTERGLPDARANKWLGLIHDGAERLAAVVEDMLDLSRIESGKAEFKCESIPLQEVMTEARVATEIGANAHRFDWAIAPEVSTVLADRNKLMQILTNLLSNAVKYSPHGGRVKVHARLMDTGDRVMVSVADEGIGIAEDDMNNLFEPFLRIRRPETEKISGTGLGLSIVKALVEAMGGEVRLESVLNQGTTAYISLPTGN